MHQNLRNKILEMIVQERERQVNAPDSHLDHQKTKNDWTSKIGYYLFENAAKPNSHQSFEEFRRSLIKTAAVILAALETSYELDDKVIQEVLQQLKDGSPDDDI